MIRKLTLGITALAVLAAFTVATQSYAQRIEEKNITVRATITSIDTRAKTITINIDTGPGEGRERVVEVGNKAKIQKDGKINLKLRDLAEGDKMSLTYRQYQDSKTGKAAYDAVQIIVLASE